MPSWVKTINSEGCALSVYDIIPDGEDSGQTPLGHALWFVFMAVLTIVHTTAFVKSPVLLIITNAVAVLSLVLVCAGVIGVTDATVNVLFKGFIIYIATYPILHLRLRQAFTGKNGGHRTLKATYAFIVVLLGGNILWTIPTLGFATNTPVLMCNLSGAVLTVTSFINFFSVMWKNRMAIDEDGTLRLGFTPWPWIAGYYLWNIFFQHLWNQGQNFSGFIHNSMCIAAIGIFCWLKGVDKSHWCEYWYASRALTLSAYFSYTISGELWVYDEDSWPGKDAYVATWCEVWIVPGALLALFNLGVLVQAAVNLYRTRAGPAEEAKSVEGCAEEPVEVEGKADAAAQAKGETVTSIAPAAGEECSSESEQFTTV